MTRSILLHSFLRLLLDTAPLLIGSTSGWKKTVVSGKKSKCNYNTTKGWQQEQMFPRDLLVSHLFWMQDGKKKCLIYNRSIINGCWMRVSARARSLSSPSRLPAETGPGDRWPCSPPRASNRPAHGLGGPLIHPSCPLDVNKGLCFDPAAKSFSAPPNSRKEYWKLDLGLPLRDKHHAIHL